MNIMRQRPYRNASLQFVTRFMFLLHQGFQAGAPGFEPRFTDSKSGVLPLHHAPMSSNHSGVDFNTKNGFLAINVNPTRKEFPKDTAVCYSTGQVSEKSNSSIFLRALLEVTSSDKPHKSLRESAALT